MENLVIVRSVEMFTSSRSHCPRYRGRSNRYWNGRRGQRVSGVRKHSATGSVEGDGGRVSEESKQLHDVRTFLDLFLDTGRVAWLQQWSYNHPKSTEVLDHFSRKKLRRRHLSKKIKSAVFSFFREKQK
ncbi:MULTISPECIES: hypothetical protein [unclassified Pseudomonas]|uniref:hypothetical protein n=1 Tax=unclassified Pseudomonas TaxID=196821 RepID=UPI001B318C57|nr:hypothetical protein [Pseudomonas sp. Tri1]